MVVSRQIDRLLNSLSLTTKKKIKAPHYWPLSGVVDSPHKRPVSNAESFSSTWRHLITFTAEPLPTIQIESSSFADDWLATLKDQLDTDVLFVLGSGTEIRAHKIVLCAASSFFADVIHLGEVGYCLWLYHTVTLWYDNLFHITIKTLI